MGLVPPVFKPQSRNDLKKAVAKCGKGLSSAASSVKRSAITFVTGNKGPDGHLRINIRVLAFMC